MKIHVGMMLVALVGLFCALGGAVAQGQTEPTASETTQDKPKPDDARIDRAKQFFQQLMKLENECDSALADLYSDEAKISNSVRYEDGWTRVWGAPAPYYKEKRKKDLAVAKEKGTRNTYTNTEFSVEGENVRIKAMCCSALNAATNPVTFLVGPGDGDRWLILEQTTQTKGKGSHGLSLPPPPPAPPGK